MCISYLFEWSLYFNDAKLLKSHCDHHLLETSNLGAVKLLWRAVTRCVFYLKKRSETRTGSQRTEVKSLSGCYANERHNLCLFNSAVIQCSPRESMYLLLRWAWNISSNCATALMEHTRLHTVHSAHKHHDLLTLGVIIFESGPSQVPHVAQLLIKWKRALLARSSDRVISSARIPLIQWALYIMK